MLTLDFVDASAIEAGVAYIVKWPAQSPDHVEVPVFTGVSIENESPADKATTSTYVDFTGTYAPVVYDAGMAHNDVLFLGGGNSLYYPDGTAATTIVAFRAYFQLNGITAGDVAKARLFFGDEESTQGIVEMRNEKGEMSNGNEGMRNGSTW